MLNFLILNRIYRYGANDRKALSPVYNQHSLSTNVIQQCSSTETHIPKQVLPHIMSIITGKVKNW